MAPRNYSLLPQFIRYESYSVTRFWTIFVLFFKNWNSIDPLSDLNSIRNSYVSISEIFDTRFSRTSSRKWKIRETNLINYFPTKGSIISWHCPQIKLSKGRPCAVLYYTSVADPEWFIPDPDPALNFESRIRIQFRMRFWIQPMLLKHILNFENLKFNQNEESTNCHFIFPSTVLSYRTHTAQNSQA